MYLSKRMASKFVLIVLFLFSWILFGFNTYNPDYTGYEKGYYEGFTGESVNGYIGSTAEIGFKFTCRIFNYFGVTYQTFLVIMSFTCLSLFAKCMNDYTESPAMAYAAYFMYPFWMNVIQIRNFISMVIIMYSIRYLTEYTKKNVMKFVILTLLAMMFHISAIVNFVLMIVYIRDVKFVVKLSVFAIVILLCVRFFGFSIIGMLINATGFLGANFLSAVGYLDYTGKYYRLMWLYFLIGGSLTLLCTYSYLTDIKAVEKNKDTTINVKLMLKYGGGKTGVG